MKTLVIDTAGAACRVCLRTPRGDVDRLEAIGRGHDQRLAPMTAALLADAGVNAIEIDRIGVVTGPGSFTGVRVGVAFARGLALVSNAPTVGLDALEAWAKSVDPELESVVAAYDAKRGEVVWRAWRGGVGIGPARLDPLPAALEALGRLADLSTWRVGGPGGAVLMSRDEAFAPPAAALWLDLAVAAEIVGPARPAYHRPPDAKLPGGIEP